MAGEGGVPVLLEAEVEVEEEEVEEVVVVEVREDLLRRTAVQMEFC